MSTFHDRFSLQRGRQSPGRPMPVVFIGHGNPMNAIEDNEFSRGWAETAKTLPAPRAILCISAHWETQGTFLTAMEIPRTIHDFYGFPRELFAMEYPAPGSPALATAAKESIVHTSAGLDTRWGLDHGCWSVVAKMYPEAAIPVVQLSLDRSKGPRWHFDLAKDLSGLRRQGVLILGSGNMVHNLGMVDWERPEGGYDWAEEINMRFKESIVQHNDESLINFSSFGRASTLAIPTVEHYLPMLYILSLREGDEAVRFFNDKSVMGSLSMTSFVIG
jgi:4,5-DOPA dioxygenase extradiol